MSLLPGIILWITDGSETCEPLVMPWSSNPVLDHETQNSSAFNPNPPTTRNLTWLKFDGSQQTLPWGIFDHPSPTNCPEAKPHSLRSQPKTHSRFSLWKWQKTKDSTSFRCDIPLRQNLRACRSTFPCPYYDNTRFRLLKISPQANKSHGKEWELKGIDIPNTSKETR